MIIDNAEFIIKMCDKEKSIIHGEKLFYEECEALRSNSVVSDIIKEFIDNKIKIKDNLNSLVLYSLGICSSIPDKDSMPFLFYAELPDIDFDCPDRSRGLIVKWIENKYGKNNVKTISNVTRFKPKSAIGIFAKGMNIPVFETEIVKDAIIDRASGDARASFCLEDTLKGTEVGKEFLIKYPEMENVKYIENHSKNKSRHAAGVIVCNEEITNYCGVDERDQTVYLDKWDSEALNLLKIDVLGLRTLAVLESFSKLINFDYNDFYTLPLNDPKAFEIFKERRLAGIFQFDGDAMASINDSIPMENFDDITACAALGRPGALSSGGTSRYIQLRRGDREPLYYCNKHKEITGITYGIVVFQEQFLRLCREISQMSWNDVSSLRKAASKSYGDEYFAQYKEKFINGAMKYSNYDEELATKAWFDISSMGSYSFNKSHSVAYGLISYWCAWSKANYPLEFVAANLNNAKDDDASLKILREFYEKEHLEYVPVEPYKSGIYWKIVDGKLIGGLTNIKGIGVQKAKGILKTRKENGEYTTAMKYKLDNPETPFDLLYPVFHNFKALYKEPLEYGLANLSLISEIEEGAGDVSIIGKMIMCDDIDANDIQSIAKRGGEILEGPHYKIHVRIEDDTGIMMCILGRFKYEQMAQFFLRAKVGNTYFAIVGKVMSGAKILLINEVANLSAQIGLNPEKEDRNSVEYKRMVNRGKHD